MVGYDSSDRTGRAERGTVVPAAAAGRREIDARCRRCWKATATIASVARNAKIETTSGARSTGNFVDILGKQGRCEIALKEQADRGFATSLLRGWY